MLKTRPAAARPQKKYIPEQEQAQYEELLEEYGRNKKLPEGYELQALLALAHYPELKDVRIEFAFKKCDIPLYTQPRIATLFKPADQRIYEIVICDETRKEMRPTLLRNLDFNTQVGVLGHELGHVVDFLDKNLLKVIKTGILYAIKKYKHRLEAGTDHVAIKHGLGWQLLGYAQLVEKLKKEYPGEKYYQTYFDYYKTSSEIKAEIKRLKVYSS